MLRITSIIILITTLGSCAFFKTQKPLGNEIKLLLTKLKATGEGRGRLSIEEQQYLFSFDAILKENTDWILAVTIPLHGEELLVLSDLKNSNGEADPLDSLGGRIEDGINEYLKSKKQSTQLTQHFLIELRTLIRFILHKDLAKMVECKEEGGFKICSLEGQSYEVFSTPKQLIVKRPVLQGHQIELIAENLTGSFFTKMSFHLHSQNDHSKRRSLLSLELFWK